MTDLTTPNIAQHLLRLSRDVAYTQGHAEVMLAAARELDALARVRELHVQATAQWFDEVDGKPITDVIPLRMCQECEHSYPCPTIRAIEGDKDPVADGGMTEWDEQPTQEAMGNTRRQDPRYRNH